MPCRPPRRGIVLRASLRAGLLLACELVEDADTSPGSSSWPQATQTRSLASGSWRTCEPVYQRAPHIAQLPEQ